MKKKILVILLSAVMAVLSVVLCACDNGIPSGGKVVEEAKFNEVVNVNNLDNVTITLASTSGSTTNNFVIKKAYTRVSTDFSTYITAFGNTTTVGKYVYMGEDNRWVTLTYNSTSLIYERSTSATKPTSYFPKVDSLKAEYFYEYDGRWIMKDSAVQQICPLFMSESATGAGKSFYMTFTDDNKIDTIVFSVTIDESTTTNTVKFGAYGSTTLTLPND